MLRISRSDANIHSRFDPAFDPVATVGPGQTLEVETAHHLALYKRELTEDDLLETLPFDLLNPLTGPIAIKGAEPGDTVVIQIDAIELGRTDQGVDGGSAFAAAVGTGKQVVAASDRDAAQSAFCRRVVDLDGAIVAVTQQCWP